MSDLRTQLDQALTALGLRPSTWVDAPVAGGSSGTTIRGIHITQARRCSTTGSSCYKPVEQFVKDFYQGILHRQPSTGSSGELATWTATLGQAQAQGSAQLLTAAQSLGSTLFGSSEYTGLSTTDEQFISDLYTGYLQRASDMSGGAYWLGVLHTSPNTRASLIAAFAGAGEFSGNVAALCTAPATGGGIRYVLSDIQGSTRAVMSNNGSSSAVIARHDYLPFGEEIGSGIGLRASTQSYSATDNNRWKYGMLQRDASTGLDHTPWRKYESLSGRWTSPDPYAASATVANPQSFNRYSYVLNDPENFTDPAGLCSFSVAIDNQSTIGADQIQAMQNRISQIFAAAGQQISFLAANANGADFNLTVYSTASGRGEASTTVGSTSLVGGRGSSVTTNGRIYVDRLTSSATATREGRILFPLSTSFLGFGLGTAKCWAIFNRRLRRLIIWPFTARLARGPGCYRSRY